jgi:hypothetical protein
MPASLHSLAPLLRSVRSAAKRHVENDGCQIDECARGNSQREPFWNQMVCRSRQLACVLLSLEAAGTLFLKKANPS